MKAYFKSVLVTLVLILISSFTVAANAATDQTFISVPQATSSQQQQTINLVKTYYEALNQKNMDLFFSIMDKQVVHDIDQANTEQGIEKFKTFMQKSNGSFNEKLTNIIIMTSADGKYAAARWLDRGVYYRTYPGMDITAKNQAYTLPGGHFFEIKDGKISRVTTYFNETDFMQQIKKQA